MDELADLMIDNGWWADDIMNATGMDEEELLERHWDNYDYE